MSTRKFTLTTLALALSVVLASCSGGTGSGGTYSPSNSNSGVANSSELDPLTTVPPVTPLPTSLANASFDIPTPQEQASKEQTDNANNVLTSKVIDSILGSTVILQQADLSFSGITDYNQMKQAWGSSAPDYSNLALLSKYGEGLAPIFNNKPAFVNTAISISTPTKASDSTTSKEDSTTASATKLLTGNNVNVGLISNSFKATVKTSDPSNIFNNDIKTVDLDSKASWEAQLDNAKKLGVSDYRYNAFVTGASLAGKRNYTANGVAENAQLYVSTVDAAQLSTNQIPENIFINQYHHAHPVAIVFDALSLANHQTSNGLANQMTTALEQVTANTSITDKPLFIIPTGDMSYADAQSKKSDFADASGTSGTDVTSKVQNAGSSKMDNYADALVKNPKITPNLLFVTGAYYDPKGIYAKAQEQFKAELNAQKTTSTDHSPATFSEQDAKAKAASTFNDKSTTSAQALNKQTLNERSNFVKALGTLQCTDATKYYCLAASADYTSGLINRSSSTTDSNSNSNNIYDHIFPVTKKDTTFSHTDFGSSYAATQVAAAAAIVKQQFPWFSAKNISTTLLTTATPVGDQRVSNEFGWGVLNVANALGGPTQFAFGDFVVNFTNQSFNAYKALVEYNKAHNTNAHYSYTSYFTHNILGDGGLYVYGTKDDTLVLTGANFYTGSTYVLGGNLVVGNSTNNPSLKVDSKTLVPGLYHSKVFVGPNSTLTGINATFNKEIVNDGVATFTNSTIACSVSGTGSLSITAGSLGNAIATNNNEHCDKKFNRMGYASKSTSNDNKPVVNISANYAGYINLTNTTVNGSILANVKDINVTNTKVHGSISSGDTGDLHDYYGGRKNKFTNVNIVNSTLDYDLNVSGNATIVDSNIGTKNNQLITLNADSQISNSKFHNLNLGKSSTFYFDPSAEVNSVNYQLGLFGKIAVAPKDKLKNKDFVPKSGQTYPIFNAFSVTGNFENEKSEIKSNQPLITYTVLTKHLDNKNPLYENYHDQVVVTAKTVATSTASAQAASGFSVIDRNLITASSPVVGNLMAKANTAYDRKNNHLVLSASDSNVLALASELQYYNTAELRSFLVKASTPIYSDAITANAITLSDQYLDFSRKVNANYFNSPDQGKVKAYLSYSFLNNFWNTEFDQESSTSATTDSSATSVAGAHSYSTNLKGKQMSNGISAGAYGQFGYYNVGLGVNYLHNSWNEYYADYANVVASQQDLLHNLGQATINTASLMLSASKTTGNYFLGTSIFGNWQGYNVSRSSLAKQDQTAKFNVYGVTANFNTGFKHLISTRSGFSGQASIAYNYNYHPKFSETASSDLAKVLSYDVKAQGSGLAYANFRAEYYYNFKLFNLDQGINLALGYTLNLFDNANQAITNSVTGVSLHTSNAFTGDNANLLKLGASYHLTLVKDLDLDLNASYYTNRYWDGYKGQATLTYSF